MSNELAGLFSSSSGAHRKPSDYEDAVQHSSEIKKLTPEQLAFIKKLPQYDLETTDAFGGCPEIEAQQYCIVFDVPMGNSGGNEGRFLLVDAQGYDYAKYTRLLSEELAEEIAGHGPGVSQTTDSHDDAAEVLEVIKTLKNPSAQQKQEILDYYVKDQGVKGDRLSDLMYDLQKAGHHNLKKPTASLDMIPMSEVRAVIRMVLALDQSESEKIIKELKSSSDSKDQQTKLDKFVVDNGLSGPDIDDLMYDVNKAGFHALKKPKSTFAPAKPAGLSEKDRRALAWSLAWLESANPGDLEQKDIAEWKFEGLRAMKDMSESALKEELKEQIEDVYQMDDEAIGRFAKDVLNIGWSKDDLKKWLA